MQVHASTRLRVPHAKRGLGSCRFRSIRSSLRPRKSSSRHLVVWPCGRRRVRISSVPSPPVVMHSRSSDLRPKTQPHPFVFVWPHLRAARRWSVFVAVRTTALVVHLSVVVVVTLLLVLPTAPRSEDNVWVERLRWHNCRCLPPPPPPPQVAS